MKPLKFYYSLYSDDGLEWRPLKIGWNLMRVVDESKDCPYAVKYYNSDHELVDRATVGSAIGDLAIMEKIYFTPACE